MNKTKIGGQYLNKDVSRILILSPRQIVLWTEKGLVVPAIKDAEGAGRKRIYGYENLLEFGLSQRLFEIGFGFHGVKRILGYLRETGNLHDWANDFEGYYKKIFEAYKTVWEKYKKTWPFKDKKLIMEFESKFLSKPYIPSKIEGFLFLFFKDDDKIIAALIPWDIEYAYNLKDTRDHSISSNGVLVINLGRIKEKIDKRI